LSLFSQPPPPPSPPSVRLAGVEPIAKHVHRFREVVRLRLVRLSARAAPGRGQAVLQVDRARHGARRVAKGAVERRVELWGRLYFVFVSGLLLCLCACVRERDGEGSSCGAREGGIPPTRQSPSHLFRRRLGRALALAHLSPRRGAARAHTRGASARSAVGNRARSRAPLCRAPSSGARACASVCCPVLSRRG